MKTALLAYRGDPDEPPPSLAKALSARGFDVRLLPIPYGAPLKGIPATVRAALARSDIDVAVVLEYNIAWALGLLKLLTRRRFEIVVVGLNQSQRLLRTGIGVVDRLLERPWQMLDRVIVHSRREAELFHDIHRIDARRFHFVPWGFDVPPFDMAPPPCATPFLCLIGRNNRDFESAIRLAEDHGHTVVIVTDGVKRPLLEGRASPRVTILYDLSFESCLSIMAQAAIQLILVEDGERGAGHISAVAGLFLGVPHVFTDVATLSDYLVDGVTGVGVPLKNPEAIAAAVARLSSDPALRTTLVDNGLEFARANLTDRVFTERCLDVIDPRP